MGLAITATRQRTLERYGLSIRDELDAFLLTLTPPWPGTEFLALKEAWLEVDRKEAAALIGDISDCDLAYGLGANARARGRSSPTTFLNRFDGNCRYFTNGWPSNWRGLTSFGFSSATTATFDAGVGVVSGTDLGIFWVQDED